MKIQKIITLLLLIITTAISAQNRNFREKKDQIKALKVAFITNELSLSSEEAAKFWPIYNEFEEKQHEVRLQKVKVFLERMDNSDIDKLSDKDALNLIAKIENNEEELFQAKKKYLNSIKTVLPPIKVLKLKKAEEEFNRKLLQQYREKSFRR